MTSLKGLLMCVVCLSMVVSAGCVNGKMTIEQAQLIASGASYTVSYAAVAFEALPVENIKKLKTILERIEPAAEALSSPDNLYVELYPVIEPEVIALFSDPSQQALILSVSSACLRSVQDLLDEYPEFKKEQEYYLKIISSAVNGLINGIEDAQANKRKREGTPG